jgi:hypothetical protein
MPQQPYMGQQPPGYPQAPWPQQGVPPQKGNSLKWLLVAIAVLLVIGVTIGATLLFTRGGDAPAAPSTSAAPGDIASADDTGPVSIITEEPTCQAYMGINNGIADLEGRGWGDERNSLGPASEWTSEQRELVQSVATGMRNAADQLVVLSKQTPNRLVREMYEQFIAYGRAYADSVPSYSPADNYLASVNVNIGSALFAMCNAITYGSTNRALGLASTSPPSGLASLGDPAEPQRFISSADPSCGPWIEQEQRFVVETSAWSRLDAAIPAAEWTPDQRASQQAVLPILASYGDEMEKLGRSSVNPVLEDFAVASAVYIDAYLTAGDTYVKADGWLSNVAFRLNNAVAAACDAPRS